MTKVQDTFTGCTCHIFGVPDIAGTRGLGL